jgi:hypothetical protein
MKKKPAELVPDGRKWSAAEWVSRRQTGKVSVAAQGRADPVERRAEACSDCRHSGDDHDRDEGRDQSILDSRRPRFVFEKRRPNALRFFVRTQDITPSSPSAGLSAEGRMVPWLRQGDRLGRIDLRALNWPIKLWPSELMTRKRRYVHGPSKRNCGPGKFSRPKQSPAMGGRAVDNLVDKVSRGSRRP